VGVCWRVPVGQDVLNDYQGSIRRNGVAAGFYACRCTVVLWLLGPRSGQMDGLPVVCPAQGAVGACGWSSVRASKKLLGILLVA
jgi:hypothetical protein